jgi:hypothetical protein
MILYVILGPLPCWPSPVAQTKDIIEMYKERLRSSLHSRCLAIFHSLLFYFAKTTMIHIAQFVTIHALILYNVKPKESYHNVMQVPNLTKVTAPGPSNRMANSRVFGVHKKTS